MRRVNENNMGFSLVELLATIAIFAVASLAIFGFLNSSTNSYGRGSNDVDVQEEAQITTNQIVDLILNTKEGISFSVTATDKTITLCSSKDPDVYMVIRWDQAKKQIFYSEYNYNATSLTWEEVASEQLLGNYVENMTLTKADGTDLPTGSVADIKELKLTLLFKKDRQLTMEQNICLRNKVDKYNQAIFDIYGH